jgi:hypothetical protein
MRDLIRLTSLCSSGAPIISITLQGPAEYSLGKKDNVTILLTYHDCTTDTNRPIILQKNFNTNLMEHRNFSLLHHSPRGLELMQRETGIGFPMKYLEENWGPKDLLATNEAVFLAPGESSTEHTALWDYEFEDGGFEVGEKYTFRYDGGEIRWWNWGTKEVSALASTNLNVKLLMKSRNGRIGRYRFIMKVTGLSSTNLPAKHQKSYFPHQTTTNL